jgi:hypothetical protein
MASRCVTSKLSSSPLPIIILLLHGSTPLCVELLEWDHDVHEWLMWLQTITDVTCAKFGWM